MFAGALLISFGILIALYPRILIALISTGLILSGATLCVLSWRWRHMKRQTHGAVSQWFLRF